MKCFLVLSFIYCFTFITPFFAQTEISWEEISDVDYPKQEEDEYSYDYSNPVFGADIYQMNGDDIMITGYLLPMDIEGEYYVLSKYPFATCFFCSPEGNIGPETVIELRLKEKYKWLQMDDILTFKGKFVLNEGDPDALFFVLKNAEVIGR